MSKPPRIPKSDADLKAELIDQLTLLRLSCEHYDKGTEAAAKHIALSLRVLLHLHGRSRALLDQLRLMSLRFYDSARPINPNNVVSEMPLLILQSSDKGIRYLPRLENGPPQRTMYRAFVNWWNDPVLRDQHVEHFSRKQLVLHVADTDGGAHVDSSLDEAYMKLSRENSLGWLFSRGQGSSEPPLNLPHLACMRQIAHELLRTLHEANNEFSLSAVPVQGWTFEGENPNASDSRYRPN